MPGFNHCTSDAIHAVERKENRPEDALGVDDEEATESDTVLLNQDTVVTRNLHALVGEEGELEVGTETALLAGLGRPGKVSVVRVGGSTCGDGPSD